MNQVMKTSRTRSLQCLINISVQAVHDGKFSFSFLLLYKEFVLAYFDQNKKIFLVEIVAGQGCSHAGFLPTKFESSFFLARVSLIRMKENCHYAICTTCQFKIVLRSGKNAGLIRHTIQIVA